MNRYTELTPTQLQATFSETGIGMHPETAGLIFGLTTHQTYTVPEMVRIVVPEGRSNPRFKLIESRLNNFIRDNSIKWVSTIRTNRRPARVYLAEHLQEQVSDRNRYLYQMEEDGLDPREFIEQFVKKRTRRKKRPDQTPCEQEPLIVPTDFHDALGTESPPMPPSHPTYQGPPNPRPATGSWLFKAIVLAGYIFLIDASNLMEELRLLVHRPPITLHGTKQDQDSMTRYRQAKAAYAQGDLETVELHLLELLKTDISLIMRYDTHLLLGHTLRRMGRYDDARFEYTSALRLHGDPQRRRTARYGIVRAYLLTDHLDQASLVLDSMPERDEEWYLLKSRYYLFKGDLEAALICAEQKPSPGNQAQKALVQALRGDLASATRSNLEAVQQVLDAGDKQAYLYTLINTAFIDLARGIDGAEAHDFIRENLAEEPDPLMEKVFLYALSAR